MRKRMTILLIVVGMLIGVGGCNSGYFVNPNVTPEQARRDCAICKYEATKASYTPMGRFDSPFMSAFQEVMQYNKVYKSCMEAKGYTWQKK